MSKALLALAAAILLAVAAWIYFSPYHSCVRAINLERETEAGRALRCAAAARD